MHVEHVESRDLTPFSLLIQQAVEILRSSKFLFVLTGAGVSAESGIPTFRGKDGLWKNYSATDLATPEAFERDPALVWEWYCWRQDIIGKAEPNPAHHALVEIEKRFENFLLLTQNVDDLHRRAGSRNVLELHGNIFRTRCLGCGKIASCQISQSLSTSQSATQLKNPSPLTGEEKGEGEKNDLPRCPCGGLLRPDVVWFGEMIPQDIWQRTLEFLSTADAAVICGTSNIVWPAAAIPEMAASHGIRTIELNLEPTPVSGLVDVSLQGKAGEILPEIIRRL